MREKRILFGKQSPGLKVFWLFMAVAVLCLGGGPLEASTVQKAVVATVSPDWSSGAHSIINVQPPRTAQNNLVPTISDITVAAYGKYFYRIERYMADNVTKFDVNNPTTPIWQYSTMDPGAVDSSNPYDLVFLNANLAVLIRYGATTAWVVNLAAPNQDAFKIGELDLSSYADADGIPEMTSGVIADNKLFILLQRLEYWCPSPGVSPYVAVLDLATGQEIDTGLGEGGRKGIPLPVSNPTVINYFSADGMVYVCGMGTYGSCGDEYDGGIIKINPITYQVSMVLDDGDAAAHPYGHFSGMALMSPTKGYVVGYAGWGDNTVYSFNPSTGVVDGPVTSLEHKNLSGMESGLYPDQNGCLWVCNQTDARMEILDPTDDSIKDQVSTDLNPQKVVFCSNADTPVAPELDVSTQGTQVTIAWTPVPSVNGYLLYYASGPTGLGVMPMGNRTSLTVNLFSGARFLFAVQPWNWSGLGAISNIGFLQIP